MVRTAANEKATQGRYRAVIAAPKGLRRVLKAGELSRAIEAADAWRAAELEIAVLREAMVTDLRKRGASWDSIGWVLGTTGSAARQRYGGRKT